MSRSATVLLATALFFGAHPASAALPVEMITDSTSSVGNLLALAIKGRIADSQTLHMSRGTEDRLQLRFWAIDVLGHQTGVAASYAVTLTWTYSEFPMPVYFQTILGHCGSDRIEDCSAEVLEIVEKNAALIETARADAAKQS